MNKAQLKIRMTELSCEGKTVIKINHKTDIPELLKEMKGKNAFAIDYWASSEINTTIDRYLIFMPLPEIRKQGISLLSKEVLEKDRSGHYLAKYF